VTPIDNRVIGPPLRSTLTRLTGITDDATLDALAATFRDRYDAVAAANSPGYPGLHDTLAAIREMGYTLFIVTNKRIHPTRLILSHLGVMPLFAGVYAPDAFDPREPDKPSVVSRVIGLHGLDAAASILVGDSVEDARAAAANALRFIAADYGYGDPDEDGTVPAARIGALSELPATVRRLSA
jgi:phosphoglycolate phosphatase